MPMAIAQLNSPWESSATWSSSSKQPSLPTSAIMASQATLKEE
jgi:hypothetical protein